MSRQDLQRGAWGAVLGVLLMVWFTASVTAQETHTSAAATAEQAKAQQEPPATQPSADAIEKLRELREEAARERERRKLVEQPPQDESAPGQTPLETPAVRAAGTAEAEDDLVGPPYAPAAPPSAERNSDSAVESTTDVDDDFLGPPYGPASPPEGGGLNGHSQASSRPSPDEKPERVEAPVSHAKGEGEWFSFQNMPWEDVIAYFVERIGKPLMSEGDVFIGGELTYVSDRKFTKDEAIDELNLILHMKGYRFIETEHHIFVVPLSEVPWYIGEDKIFATREAFEQADLRPMDFVTVFIQVKDHPAQTVQDVFELMFSDDLTMSTSGLEGSNQLKMIGLVKEIRKALTLMGRIKIDENDPREMKVFTVETNAQQVEELVRDILGVGSGTSRRLQRDPRTGRMVPVPAGDDDDSVRMTADDRTNTIIVKAIPAKLAEIAELIQTFDKKTDLEFETVVIEIQNANAVDVAELLNKIFSQEQGESTPNWQRMRQIQQQQASRARATRGRTTQTTQQPQSATPEAVMGEGMVERAKKTIRLAADERTNSLIVYANKEGQQRVRELLKTIDMAQPSNFKTIKLENAEAARGLPDVEPDCSEPRHVRLTRARCEHRAG